MDWATVTSNAITGAVGIAGVVGGVISARIAGNSARKSAQLNIGAEANRARLADKRRIYARAVSALDTAMLADGAAATSEKHAQSEEASGAAKDTVIDQYTKSIGFRAKATEALVSANEAVSELQLMVESPATVKLAKDALDNVGDSAAYTSHRNKLFSALCDDLREEARRAYRPT